MERWTSWREAAERALYGESGFFLRAEGPAEHFRTSVHASKLFADAVARLLRLVDDSLGRPERLDAVDVGAGSGELAESLLRSAGSDLEGRLRVHAVERSPRPEGLDPRITWADRLPEAVTGLVFANEWLDNVPLDVAQVDPNGTVRLVLVGPGGEERPGPAVADADAKWLERWWPLGGSEASAGERAEIGEPRDEAWAAAVGSLRRGLAVAVDYAHERDSRPPFGTLTGFRDGREVRPVPDGSCDITAHVAMDACAAAGERTRAGVDATVLTTQRAALRSLGVCGRRPPLSLASRDPAGYVMAMADAGEAAELMDVDGLGSFTWLLQGVGMTVPAAIIGSSH